MTHKKHWRDYVPRVLAGLAIAILLGVLVYFVAQIDSTKLEKKEKKVQVISLVKPPPPPPPPPPQKIEKAPEPKIEEKIEQPEPEPEPEEPLEDSPEEAPADTGLDAEGTAGSDGFGLVGRKGGKGLLGGGSPTAWYSGVIKNKVVELLSDREELRRSKYSVTVHIWFDTEGNVQRYQLIKTSQDSKIDAILDAQLAKLKKLPKAPPGGVNPPVKIRITSRI